MRFIFINTGTIDQNAGIIRCLGLGEQLVRLGHSVFILINDHPENKKHYGNNFKGIEFIYSQSGTVVEQVDKFFKICQLKKIDYIHCMGVGSSIFLPALIGKKLFKRSTKIILDFEDRQVLLAPEQKRSIMRFYERLGVRNADIVICASKELSVFLNNEYNIETNYLPFAVNTKLNIIKKDKNSNNGTITIGYIGSLIDAYENQIILLLNIVKIAEGTIKLLIGGKGQLESSLKKMVNKLNISDKVEFCGFIPDENLTVFFSKVDVLVFYLPENDLNKYRCPNKAFLYASTGLPIVASDFGEVKNILKNYPRVVFFNNDYPIEEFLNSVLIANTKNEIINEDFYQKNNWSIRTEQYLDILNSYYENIN